MIFLPNIAIAIATVVRQQDVSVLVLGCFTPAGILDMRFVAVFFPMCLGYIIMYPCLLHSCPEKPTEEIGTQELEATAGEYA